MKILLRLTVSSVASYLACFDASVVLIVFNSIERLTMDITVSCLPKKNNR